jgi:hypothetical protein
MNALIVRALPTSSPDDGHINETLRALQAQGHDADAGIALRLLWTTRALPAAVLAIADQRSRVALDRSRLVRPRVHVRARVPGRPLLAVCALEPGADELHVRFLDEQRRGAPAHALVAFEIEREDREAPVVHRFSHGG